MANLEKERRALEPTTAIVLVLSIIGAINWGTIGFFNFNFVDWILGGGAHETTSFAARIVYAIVGVSGVILAVLYPTLRSRTAKQVGAGASTRRIEAR